MVRAGLRIWVGLKLVTVLVAVHLFYLASSQLKALGFSFINFKAPDYQPQASSVAPDQGLRLWAGGNWGEAVVPPPVGAPPEPTSPKSLTWAIFTPPKPFAGNPHQLVALRSWLSLRIKPRVYLVEASDLDPTEMEAMRREYGVKTVKCRTNKDGLLLQDAIFERASEESDVDVVVVINADIILGDDFIDALELAERGFPRFLLIGARYDSLEKEEIPPDAGADWVAGFRERTLRSGALHTYGGTDYYAWRPVGDPSLSAIGGRIPPFTYGRGKADNWIVDMAVENQVVQVIDASTGVMAIHPAHGYHLSKDSTAQLAPPSSGQDPGGDPAAVGRQLAVVSDKAVGDKGGGGKYVNFWSAKSAGDPYADFNKHLAYTFGSYVNMEGTPLHAPWALMRCVADPSSGAEVPCLRRRARPAACPCEHSPYVSGTLTDVELQSGGVKVCGKVSKTLTESFDEEFAFAALVRQRAQDGAVVLIGFNYGYQDMLLNMVCRLQQLGVSNYVIAAFDAEAFTFCRRQVLPCFPIAAGGKGAGSDAPQVYGSQGFRALTKLKSQQVLRILRLGYDVVWSDVDIFWKVDIIPRLRADAGPADIAIQSNAPPEEKADNGRRRINSGLYLVRHSPATVEAFQQIVDHAKASTLSEQPSFYSILCGEHMEYTKGLRDCANTDIPVTTRLLDRRVYPNGAMSEVIAGVTPTSADGVAIVHFNWMEGHENKVSSFVNASMWLLDEQGVCMYSSASGSAPAAKRRVSLRRRAGA